MIDNCPRVFCQGLWDYGASLCNAINQLLIPCCLTFGIIIIERNKIFSSNPLLENIFYLQRFLFFTTVDVTLDFKIFLNVRRISLTPVPKVQHARHYLCRERFDVVQLLVRGRIVKKKKSIICREYLLEKVHDTDINTDNNTKMQQKLKSGYGKSQWGVSLLLWACR